MVLVINFFALLPTQKSLEQFRKSKYGFVCYLVKPPPTDNMSPQNFPKITHPNWHFMTG